MTDLRPAGADQAWYVALQAITWANAALVKNGRLVVMLTVRSPAAHAWTAEELALVDQIAPSKARERRTRCKQAL